MTPHDPFPGLPDAAPAAVSAAVDACERFLAHLGLLAGQLRELPPDPAGAAQVREATARVGVVLAELTAAAAGQRP
ncbi:hypothetical protein HS041_28405 [Planomonospora sp. ID67723]|uniref:hypothetical protein n=1 Tax=Planomonospora sp. ID67723 TaxID=2738134 RepID=UPI0018C43631|nr:hypothetical protein [Planomonospora sp. ID67723]MBG0831657.1 hypothetical protein [Planomonospora sp. ID67723]